MSDMYMMKPYVCGKTRIHRNCSFLVNHWYLKTPSLPISILADTNLVNKSPKFPTTQKNSHKISHKSEDFASCIIVKKKVL